MGLGDVRISITSIFLLLKSLFSHAPKMRANPMIINFYKCKFKMFAARKSIPGPPHPFLDYVPEKFSKTMFAGVEWV